MWNIITLDGCFEGEKNWDLDFHDLVWGPELDQLSIEQLKVADMLVFGDVYLRRHGEVLADRQRKSRRFDEQSQKSSVLENARKSRLEQYSHRERCCI